MQLATAENPVFSFAFAAGLALVALVALALYSKRRDIAAAVDPTSASNLAYQGVNAAGAVLTGTTDGSFTLGGFVYDLTHPNAPRADAPVEIVDQSEDVDASLSPDGWMPYLLDVPGGQGASGSW